MESIGLFTMVPLNGLHQLLSSLQRINLYMSSPISGTEEVFEAKPISNAENTRYIQRQGENLICNGNGFEP